MRIPRTCLAAIAAALLSSALLSSAPVARAAGPQAAAPRYDIVIRNGHIIDGTGSPWYAGDIAIEGGRIAAIGHIPAADGRRVIDASGMVVAPGFIDMLGQSDLSMLVDPRQPSKIFQGITTEITGEGESPAPQDDAMIRSRRAASARYGIKADWHTLPDYFARLRQRGMGINMGVYVGATSVREMVLGYADRAPTAAELARMQELVADAMRAGAFGVSTALQYPPAPYAKTGELIALAQTAARYGGIYATHMRSEGNSEMAALDESFRIAREAGIPVEIFHLKAAGKHNWGNAGKIIQRIDDARAAGLDIAADTYAYTAWSNDLAAFTPPWASVGGTAKLIERLQDPATRAKIREAMLTPSDAWDNDWLEIDGPKDILIVAVGNPALQRYVGKRMSEVAADWHEDPIDTILDFLIKDDAATSVAVFGMAQPDVSLILKQPWVSIDTDSQGTSPEGILGKERPHPRAYGTFPRILRKYVRAEHLITLPDAIRKFTSLAAQRMRLTDRGVLKRGMWADVVVFDPDKIRDLSTFEDPNQLSVGMQYVLVNGVPVIDKGRMTGALPGKVLLGEGHAAD